MATNLIQVLYDSAELTSLPDWLRNELRTAATRLEENENTIRNLKKKLKQRASLDELTRIDQELGLYEVVDNSLVQSYNSKDERSER